MVSIIDWTGTGEEGTYDQSTGILELPPGNRSFEEQEFLNTLAIQTIWSPIRVTGAARGLFGPDAVQAARILGLESTLPSRVTWFRTHGSIVWVPKHHLEDIRNLPQRQDILYAPNVNPKKLIVNRIEGNGPFYSLPDGLSARNFQDYFMLDRVPESPIDMEIFKFPSLNTDDPIDNSVWKLPIPLGTEDLPLEIAYRNVTNQWDPKYLEYRLTELNKLSLSDKFALINRSER